MPWRIRAHHRWCALDLCLLAEGHQLHDLKVRAPKGLALATLAGSVVRKLLCSLLVAAPVDEAAGCLRRVVAAIKGRRVVAAIEIEGVKQ